MFPYVIAQHGIITVCKWAILVGCGGDGKIAAPIQDEPDPTGAEALGTSVVESCLKGIERAKFSVNRGCQVTGRCAAAVRLHDLPEHGMVGMTTTIVADSSADALW